MNVIGLNCVVVNLPSPVRVLPGFTGFYWVLLGFTGFSSVLEGQSANQRPVKEETGHGNDRWRWVATPTSSGRHFVSVGGRLRATRRLDDDAPMRGQDSRAPFSDAPHYAEADDRRQSHPVTEGSGDGVGGGAGGHAPVSPVGASILFSFFYLFFFVVVVLFLFCGSLSLCLFLFLMIRHRIRYEGIDIGRHPMPRGGGKPTPPSRRATTRQTR